MDAVPHEKTVSPSCDESRSRVYYVCPSLRVDSAGTKVPNVVLIQLGFTFSDLLQALYLDSLTFDFKAGTIFFRDSYSFDQTWY